MTPRFSLLVASPKLYNRTQSVLILQILEMPLNRKIVMMLAIPLIFGAATALAGEGLQANKAASAVPNQDRSAEGIVIATCVECHGPGKKDAPRMDDRDEWMRRASKGLDALTLAAIRGHGEMPSRGGRADLTDPEFESAIFYMFEKAMGSPVKK